MKETLAINGGKPAVDFELPGRRLFDAEELEAVKSVFEHSWKTGKDFGYQGQFEQRYTDAFCKLQGGGFADAVSSGTAAFFSVLGALNLPRGGEIILPPVSDPGGISPAIYMGLNCRIADSQQGSHHTTLEEVEKVVTEETSAIVVVHVAGVPLEIEPIAEFAKANNIFLIEDCSQAHAASYKGQKVGTFADISFFSTMFSKNHASGGCGGIVFTKSEELYQKARAFADRGKPYWQENYDPKNPNDFISAGLNFQQNELSSAIGVSTLAKLPSTIQRRTEILLRINEALSNMATLRPIAYAEYIEPSPFFLQVGINASEVKDLIGELKQAVQAEGIPINPNYQYVTSEWPWMKDHLPQGHSTPNASKFREESFNILYHEKFTDRDVSAIIEGLEKVDKAFT